MSTSDLTVAPCDFQAARHAVLNWHYSRLMPKGKLVSYGVWEDGRFIGVVLFGRGASPFIGVRYSLQQIELAELVRVAFRPHRFATSTAVAAALTRLRTDNPGLRLVISFADERHGHLGTIYQATNWIYTGRTTAEWDRINGTMLQGISTLRRHGTRDLTWLRANVDPNAERVMMPAKHRYLYPLDKAMRRQVEKLRQPYPKAVASSPAAEVSM